jgi:hypothetical protein
LARSCSVSESVMSFISRFLVFADPNGPVTKAPGHEGPLEPIKATITIIRKRTCRRMRQRTKSARRVGPARLTGRWRARTGMCERPGQTEKTPVTTAPDRVATLKESNDSHQLTKAAPMDSSNGRDSRFGLARPVHRMFNHWKNHIVRQNGPAV